MSNIFISNNDKLIIKRKQMSHRTQTSRLDLWRRSSTLDFLCGHAHFFCLSPTTISLIVSTSCFLPWMDILINSAPVPACFLALIKRSHFINPIILWIAHIHLVWYSDFEWASKPPAQPSWRAFHYSYPSCCLFRLRLDELCYWVGAGGYEG